MRRLLFDAKQNGAFQFQYLSFKQKVKWFLFLYMGMWEFLFGLKEIPFMMVKRTLKIVNTRVN